MVHGPRRWNSITLCAAELVFRAANDLQYFGKLTYKLLQNVQEAQSFDGNPLYAVLHEALYCQGYALSQAVVLSCKYLLTQHVMGDRQKSDWSAARVIEKYPQCSWATMQDSEGPVYFTGEMVSLGSDIKLAMV